MEQLGVSSVSYVPSRGNPIYEGRDDARLAALHGIVATAARFGVFRIEGGRRNRDEARQMGDRIRVLKGYDATLGIYAAYAYAQADITEQVRSVRQFMLQVYGIDLFDLGLLSGVLSNVQSGTVRAALPSFPMLSQGWSLLRVRNVHLPEPIARAQDYLLPSLWSTFSDRGMGLVEQALFAT